MLKGVYKKKIIWYTLKISAILVWWTTWLTWDSRTVKKFFKNWLTQKTLTDILNIVVRHDSAKQNKYPVVGMVKRLTRRIVAPLCMGSIPITHPTTQGCSQAVRYRTLTPTCDGSIPSTPAILWPTSSVGRAPDF